MSATGGTQPGSAAGPARLFRDSAATLVTYGRVVAPGAGANIANRFPPAGTYEVTAMVWYGTTPDVEDNVRLVANAATIASPFPVQPVANGQPIPVTVVVVCDGVNQIAIQAIAAGAAGSVYKALLTFRPVE